MLDDVDELPADIDIDSGALRGGWPDRLVDVGPLDREDSFSLP
jgi:hypothetical protein